MTTGGTISGHIGGNVKFQVFRRGSLSHFRPRVNKKADGLSAFGEKAGIYSRPPDRALGLLLPRNIALSSPQEENPPA